MTRTVVQTIRRDGTPTALSVDAPSPNPPDTVRGHLHRAGQGVCRKWRRDDDYLSATVMSMMIVEGFGECLQFVTMD
ncbi:trehalose 6-phosphate synthase family member (tps-1) [Anopheles sinensis]|uniref:Trehalose 6-phosphate synthase family member (Tps-1) n=1 Tax=Anopheles sinensis TaxID=74873 RepID=A0A084W4X1_ANOSI|nr:trehalose 6-phosphate synthase family member (tps-1) [Anopheles sinensis]